LYKAVNLDRIIVLDDSVDMKIAAFGFMNPMTALGLVYFLKQHDVKGVI
jgi:NADPH:quinone reductase-like Zn-dependent oxidoreductase